MFEPPPSEEPINFTLNQIIMVPSPQRERRMAIRYLDWLRLRRNIAQVRDSDTWLSKAYSVLFGISATSFLSIYPLTVLSDLPPCG